MFPILEEGEVFGPLSRNLVPVPDYSCMTTASVPLACTATPPPTDRTGGSLCGIVYTRSHSGVEGARSVGRLTTTSGSSPLRSPTLNLLPLRRGPLSSLRKSHFKLSYDCFRVHITTLLVSVLHPLSRSGTGVFLNPGNIDPFVLCLLLRTLRGYYGVGTHSKSASFPMTSRRRDGMVNP